MSGCRGPITTFIIEPFIPHNEEFYLNIVSDRLGCSVSFSECGGIEIEENWDKVLLDTNLPIISYSKALSNVKLCLMFCYSLLIHNLPRDLSFIQVKTISVPTGVSFTSEVCAPLVATLPLEVISEESMTQCFFFLAFVMDLLLLLGQNFSGINPFID